LDGTNTTFTDGQLVYDSDWDSNGDLLTNDSTDLPDTHLFQQTPAPDRGFPFQYVLFTTELHITGYFTAKDPFSGTIIESDSFTIESELPSENFGVFILDNNLLSSGSYIP
jgi:hypothetical protein